MTVLFLYNVPLKKNVLITCLHDGWWYLFPITYHCSLFCTTLTVLPPDFVVAWVSYQWWIKVQLLSSFFFLRTSFCFSLSSILHFLYCYLLVLLFVLSMQVWVFVCYFNQNVHVIFFQRTSFYHRCHSQTIPPSVIYESAVELCFMSLLESMYHSIMVLTTVSFSNLHLHTVVLLYSTPTLVFPLSFSPFRVFVVVLHSLVYVCAHFFFESRPFSSVYFYDTSMAVYLFLRY